MRPCFSPFTPVEAKREAKTEHFSSRLWAESLTCYFLEMYWFCDWIINHWTLLWMTNKDLKNGYEMEHLKHFGDEPLRSLGIFVHSEAEKTRTEVFTYVSILSLRQLFVWGSLLNESPRVYLIHLIQVWLLTQQICHKLHLNGKKQWLLSQCRAFFSPYCKKIWLIFLLCRKTN